MSIFNEGDRVQLIINPGFVGTVKDTNVPDSFESDDRESIWIAVQWDGHNFYTYLKADSLELIKK